MRKKPINLSQDQLRKKFSIPAKIYLANHALGCLPKQTIKEAQNFFTLWETKGVNAWETWLNEINNFCQALANLFNASVDEFCPQTNISSALYKILTSVPKRKGRNKILISDLDFPSVGFVFSQAKSQNYTLEYVKQHKGVYDLQSWKDKLTTDIQLVFITHVLSDNSFQNDVTEIIRLAKEKEIFTIVDVAQSAGVIPINLQQWSADFMVGSCIKWLCGGPGAGFLWMNSNNQSQFYPEEVGWFSHQDPFEFDISNFRYAPNARRYWGGTPSVLPFITAQKGIELINAIGIEKIHRHNQALIQTLLEKTLAAGFEVSSPLTPSQRGGTLVIKFKELSKIAHFFQKNHIIIDYRDKFGIRISPHIYNTQEEIAKIAAYLLELKKIGYT